LRRSLAIAFVMAAATLGAGRDAFALSFEDISGRWCGSVSSYTFTPTMLIVTIYADNSRREYPVDDYQYDGDVVTVNWQRDGNKLFTKFSDFDAANRIMAQIKNDVGPRREFRHCAPEN
jgi:hypothetical protein